MSEAGGQCVTSNLPLIKKSYTTKPGLVVQSTSAAHGKVSQKWGAVFPIRDKCRSESSHI